MSFKKKVVNLALSSILATSLISGCSKDSNPAAPEQPTHVEIQSNITNKDGYAIFNNDESELKVRCISQSGQPVQSVQVFYNNGTPENQYEVLSFVPPAGYRPIVRFDTNLNNKINIMETLQNLNDSDYILRQITGTDEKTALRNFLNFYLPNINNSLLQSSFRYGGTFTGEQLRDSYRITINTLLFVGSNISGGPVPVNEVLSGINEQISLEQVLEQSYNFETNWDVYWFSPFGLPIKAFHVLMPSNKPTVTQNSPQVNGNSVTLSWQGQDAKNYFQNLIPISDPTIQFGPTTGSDLFYTVNVLKNNQPFTTIGTNQLTKVLTSLPEGIYKASIEVVDDTNVNKTSTTLTNTDKTFTIGSTPSLERIVFTKLSDIYSISSAGTNLTRIGTGRNPSINPANNSMAIEEDATNGNQEIFIRSSNGSLEQITNSVDGSNAPSFNWQGNRLVYIKDSDLYTMLLSDRLETSVVTTGSPLEPSLNQTGDKVVFSTNRDGNWEIYSCNINGTNPQRLTNSLLLDSEPNFNRDSNKIVFTRNDDIYTMNADGSNQTNLTNSIAQERQPCFSPDGTKIVFARWNGYWDLWTMDTTGSNQINITNTSNVSENQPDWK